MSRRPPKRRGATPAPHTTLRLIGGEWRGRRVPILDAPGLRPTPDRIRETLFNWLAPAIEGARCLDMFAGSGVLGLEALSRGAASTRFIEQLPAAVRTLETAIATLGAAERASVTRGDALAALPPERFDIVFIDPPFAEALHAPALDAAIAVLAPHGRVYLEYPIGRREAVHDLLQDRFDLLRDKQAGQVGYCLARAI